MRIPDDLGRIVKFHRKESRLTQVELARLAGVGKTVVFDIENGKTTVRLDTACRILSVLNIQLKAVSPMMPAMERIAEENGKEGR